MRKLWFDDGYASTFNIAYPVMKRHGLTGIVAVVTSIVGKFGKLPSTRRGPFKFMTIKQLIMLIEEGWEIASHTVTHPFRFDLLNTEETVYELEVSKEWIEEKLGFIPMKFVVPRHLIREEQMELARKYYPYVRPLGNPVKGHVIFHRLTGKNAFGRELRKRGVRWGL